MYELAAAEHVRAGDRHFGDRITATGTVAGNVMTVSSLCFTPGFNNHRHTQYCYGDAYTTTTTTTTTTLPTNVTYTGYVTDNLCWNKHGHVAIDGTNMAKEPEKHMLYCLRLDACRNSGYSMMENTGF